MFLVVIFCKFIAKLQKRAKSHLSVRFRTFLTFFKFCNLLYINILIFGTIFAVYN